MSSKEMQISEEEYYATLLSNPDYSETKFSIYRKEHLDVVKCSLSSYWQKSSKKVYQYDKHGNFIAVWNKCKDVVDFLYGIGANGNLSRNIKLNNKRGKLGFSKNGYIWSFFAPQGKEEL